MQSCALRPTAAPRTARNIPPRPAFVVLAQLEDGPVVAVITSDPAGWKEDLLRASHCAFAHLKVFDFKSVVEAGLVIASFGLEVAKRFGRDCFVINHEMSKAFKADWHVAFDLFTREHKLAA